LMKASMLVLFPEQIFLMLIGNYSLSFLKI